MTVLEWDKVGERFYETGIDRAVLYLPDGTYAAWNGLTGLDDGTNSELKSYYMDGVKFLERVTPGEFVGKLKALTYPDEFEKVLGVSPFVSPGLYFHEQPPKKFGLTYRTKIGNDLTEEYGYVINILYNLSAVPDSISRDSMKETISPEEFSWALTATPVSPSGFRPTARISIKSTETSPAVLTAIENILYGTATTSPRLPSIDEVTTIFKEIGALLITQLGDGHWRATDLDDSYISMVDSTTFDISDANITWKNPYTYSISDTFVHNLANPALASFTLRAANNSIWAVTITTDGTIDVSASVSDIHTLNSVKLKSPSGDGWSITATDDGTLNISSIPPQTYYLDEIRMNSSDNNVWLVTATNDGYIDVSEE